MKGQAIWAKCGRGCILRAETRRTRGDLSSSRGYRGREVGRSYRGSSRGYRGVWEVGGVIGGVAGVIGGLGGEALEG